MGSIPNALLTRFSIEQLTEARYVLVDWMYGTIGAAGTGTLPQQERLRLQAIHACQSFGDVNILKLTRGMKQGQEWSGGIKPAERPGWLAEQREILKAYGRISDILRRRKIPASLTGTDPDIVRAVRDAERLRSAALKRISLDFDSPETLGELVQQLLDTEVLKANPS